VRRTALIDADTCLYQPAYNLTSTHVLPRGGDRGARLLGCRWVPLVWRLVGSAFGLSGQMSAARPLIEESIKRQVRQRYAFGCVVCGSPLYEYDHIVPYSQVGTHEVENLVLLCDGHHREKTNGLLTEKQVRSAAADPFNIRAGASTPYLLHYDGSRGQVTMGSVGYTWDDLRRFLFTIPLIIDNLPIVVLTLQDQTCLSRSSSWDRPTK